MGKLRRLAATAAVSALFAAGVPQAAFAVGAHANTASASESSESGKESGKPWYDPRGWFSDSEPAKPKSSSVSWHRPAGRANTHGIKADPKAHRIRELTSRRSANASFYQLSDGRVQEVVSADPLNYRDTKGAWRPVSTKVRKVAHNAYTLGAVDNSFRTYFSKDPSALLRIEQGGGHVQMGADGARAVTPTLTGDKVTFKDALPDADLTYRVGRSGVQENIVLAKAPAAGASSSWAFTLKIGGYTPKQRPDGSIALYAGESGNPALVVPAPYMTDSRPDASSPYGKTYSTKVSQHMDWDAGTGTLRLTVRPDKAWLSSPARQYPVVIDPTVVVAPTPSQAANVMISSDGPADNYVTSWRLSAGTTTSGVARTLVRFPLPSSAAGSTLTSATLKLYYDQTFTTGANAVPLEAHAATAAWDPTSATWNSAKGISGALAGSATKAANATGVWNSYPVTSTVQSWLNGTTANNGFVIQAKNESTLGQGGPRYEGSIYAYGGETAVYPQLVLTWGVPGVAVDPPSVIHSTGAELSWPAYTNTTGDPANDLAEYQVHRSWLQTFTPNASSEIAPLKPDSRTFTDTTAQPTPTSSSEQNGNAYYYMVAVKTKSGALIPGPTQLVRLPKAGLTTMILRGAKATTLSSAQPNTVLNTLTESGVQQPWLEVGDNSSTYGRARAVLDFGALPSSIPSDATVTDSYLKLWQETTTTTTAAGAAYELHALTRSFTASQATWNNAATGTAWTTAGGDLDATATGSDANFSNDPQRRTLNATSIVQGWVKNPATNHGLAVKLGTEGSQERTVFAGPATAEPALAPQLVITYEQPNAESTYFAPSTPHKMAPGTTYTVPVTLNNTTGSTWAASRWKLTYHWTLPDGTDVTTSANQVTTALPADMVPGSQTTLDAKATPPTPSDGNRRGAYSLDWDLLDTSTGTYLSGASASASSSAGTGKVMKAQAASAAGGIGSLSQAVGVEEPGSNQLGLENFYQYTEVPTGSGGALFSQDASGNTVWNYDAFSNPSRGFATFVRLSYNSLDTTDSVLGYGWSVQASTPTRLGTPLDFHPNPHPTDVTFTDGDGTSHVFSYDDDAGTWTPPPGVNLYLQQLADCGPQVTNARAWEMTRPDRTQFFYDCDGYPTSVVDKNGNEADFTYTARRSQNKPTEFLDYITDAAGRQTLTVNYWAKGDDYSYVDDSGNLVSDTNLTNPKIIDQIRSVTDISGRTLEFYYTTQGLMGRMVDGAGDSKAKTFKFAYDATQGNKNVKLVGATDPRGNTTHLTYYDAPTDPKVHWWTRSITDRAGKTVANLAYTEPGTVTGSAVKTTVTNAKGKDSVLELDSSGRLLKETNALGEATSLTWDSDNNVASLTQPNGAVSTWSYDPVTGYPLTTKDALAQKNGTAGTTYTYRTALGGHVADVTDKLSPTGRHWHFTYDDKGNLTTLQDPMGTAAGSGYTTSYTYDAYGQLRTTTDALGHSSGYDDYGPTGYPATARDAMGNTAKTGYDSRGLVLSVSDPSGATTSQDYDVFGRPTVNKVPLDTAKNQYITTPAPVYDANDNMVASTAANGAESSATFDADDRLVSSTEPPDTPTSPVRTTTNTYDEVGDLLTVTAPKGNLPGAAAGSYTTTYGYDALNRQVSVTDALGDRSTVAYDNVGNVVTTTDPVKNATPGNTAVSTRTDYDLDSRPVKYTDAAGNSSSVVYDLEGFRTQATDRNGNTTRYTYDADGRITQVQVPHVSSGGTVTYDTGKYVYDQVGNITEVISPRGVATAVEHDYSQQYKYDADNRKIAALGAYDPNDAFYNKAPETDYTYDAVGRVKEVSAPPSGSQTVPQVTKYSYWDTGWTKSSTDPWSIGTSYTYDELGQQTGRTITSAGGSSSRTQTWSYYPDGKLKTRSDSGVPVGLQVVMVDNSDAQNVTSGGTWTAGDSAQGHEGYDYRTHAAGSGTDSFTWNLQIPQDGNYQVYVKYPLVTGAATNAKYTVHHDGTESTSTVDQSTKAGDWVPLGSYAFTRNGTGQQIDLAQNTGGTVSADAVKLVRDNSADQQKNPEAFTYTYDPDGNNTEIADSSPGAQFDQYTYTYDGLDRLSQLQEKLDGTAKHTTAFTYDADSHPLSQNQDGATSAYTYDARNLLKSVVNKESASDPAPKTTSWTYTPTAQVATETKGNGNVVTSTYNLDDSLATQIEKTTGGTLVAKNSYTYDPNGNRTQNVSSIQNADTHGSYLDRTADYTYTPADQVQKVTNSDGHANQSYTYDKAGNITTENIGGAVTTNTYDRNRLITSDQNGTLGKYNYDPFGRTDTVTVGGTVEQRYTYDGYDRVASSEQYNGTGLTRTDYAYDAFDRTVSQTENAGTGNASTTAFTYLATSGAVVAESVDGELKKNYQYSPWGERLDQIIHNDDGTEDPGYYSYDATTNVQAVTGTSGETTATYGYTAYGADDPSQATGKDTDVADDPGGSGDGSGDPGGSGDTTTEEPYNSYRYGANRVEPGTGTYDTGFRDYDPGLNRFLSQDLYEDALSDSGLSTDPYTGNRYAFGGGNPLSNIELDGHSWLSDHGFARFVVDSAGAVTDELTTVDQVMGKLRDDYIKQMIAQTSVGQNRSKTFVAGYDPVTKRYAAGRSSNPVGCAERDVSRKLGIPMEEIYFSRAKQVLSGTKWRWIDVCRNCQVDSEPTQFTEGTGGYEGGRWGTDVPLGTDPADLPGKALVPVERPSTSGTAAKASGAGADLAKAGSTLSKVSTAFKWAGRGFMALGIAADIYDVATAPDGQKAHVAVEDTATLAGAWAGAELGAEGGAAIGAAIGSVVPGLGTAAGGLVGGIVGGIGGAIVGGGIGSKAGHFLSGLF